MRENRKIKKKDRVEKGKARDHLIQLGSEAQELDQCSPSQHNRTIIKGLI